LKDEEMQDQDLFRARVANFAPERSDIKDDDKLVYFVRWILAQQTARGGEIKNLFGSPHVSGGWQELPATWFEWEDLLSIPWKQQDEINVSEARARNLATRARARVVPLQVQRYLHLMDSQVNLSIAAKGRSGSFRLAHVNRHTCATLLASGLRDVNGYTGSERNPADAASRDRKAWRAFKRSRQRGAQTATQRLLEAAPARAVSGAMEQARPGP
jgi:hypothetical protein